MKPLQMFAATQPGLENLLLKEFAHLNVVLKKNIFIDTKAVPGGVEFSGHRLALYSANFNLRTATRVLLRVGKPFRAYYKNAFVEELEKAVEWSDYFSSKNKVSLHTRVTSTNSKLFHTGLIDQLVREALDGHINSNTGDNQNGQRLIVNGHNDRFRVSIDTSGDDLFKRFYKTGESGDMPLRENVAAGLLQELEWDPKTPLIDPCCGTGTIPIEAALIRSRTAPGLVRTENAEATDAYAFQQWPSYEPKTYKAVVETAQKAVKQTAPSGGPYILGFDRSKQAIQTARRCAERANVSTYINFEQKGIKAFTPPWKQGMIVLNPPYGPRAGEVRRLRSFFSNLGDVMRKVGNTMHLGILMPTALDSRQNLFATGLSWYNLGTPISVGGRRLQISKCFMDDEVPEEVKSSQVEKPEIPKRRNSTVYHDEDHMGYDERKEERPTFSNRREPSEEDLRRSSTRENAGYVERKGSRRTFRKYRRDDDERERENAGYVERKGPRRTFRKYRRGDDEREPYNSSRGSSVPSGRIERQSEREKSHPWDAWRAKKGDGKYAKGNRKTDAEWLDEEQKQRNAIRIMKKNQERRSAGIVGDRVTLDALTKKRRL
eukprot:CAMPEP_0203748440 /NCGR_PEP_ID=MMETSP0098-20131031/3325_1 /ASSEMBLY_ACC=CAM_ASM_000208 /TAXON_ID=96639 /ORGANISM=" , Strain NY0313808BC1" /LENGTH=602 /DNA_ID=CAMNT_0050637189 /DNA_START=427 /DNA_END=2235 /DNA_ORIENTATION=-